MRVAMFSVHAFDREFFDEANAGRGHDLHYLEARLTLATATLARDFPAVCAFVNDQLSAEVLTILGSGGTGSICTATLWGSSVPARSGRSSPGSFLA